MIYLGKISVILLSRLFNTGKMVIDIDLETVFSVITNLQTIFRRFFFLKQRRNILKNTLVKTSAFQFDM